MPPNPNKLRSAIVATSITVITLVGLVSGFALQVPTAKPKQTQQPIYTTTPSAAQSQSQSQSQSKSKSKSPIHATLAELGRTREREVAKKLDLQRKIAEVEAMAEQRRRADAAAAAAAGGERGDKEGG